ncbi:MAG: hypothetical protein HQ523_04880 [Lentisphaerae bacterium]|nr:hypothetical protein [Lentisphaerota bacterium]
MDVFKQPRVSQVVWPWTAQLAPPPPPPSCHRRAIIQAAVMTAIAALLSLKYRHAAITVSCVAAFVILSGCFASKLFLAVERGFQAFGRLVGLVLTWVLLVPFFALVFVPGRLMLLMRGKDPLNRAFPDAGQTGWQPHQTRKDKNHYTKQYK